MSRKSHSMKEACLSAASASNQVPDSLGTSKPARFGATLRAAIKECFGTSRAFASALGVTEGRVSQLVNGDESITPSTLEEILAAFEDVGTQESLHQAWAQTFAPSPLLLTSALEGEALAERLLASFSALVASGNARTLLRSLQQSAPSSHDPELRFRIERAIIDLALYLDRPSLARDGASAMLREARECSSNRWIATALFCRANASRLDDTLPAAELVRLHEEFTAFMANWTPATDDQAAFERLRMGAVRDRGLTLLAGQRAGGIRKEHLSAGTEPLARLTRELNEPIERAIALEVLGRLLVAEGALFAAEDVLDEVRAIRGLVSYDHDPKTRLLKAQLLIARRELDGADELLRAAITASETIDDRHHTALAERLRLHLPR